jgi:hypothetical protein
VKHCGESRETTFHNFFEDNVRGIDSELRSRAVMVVDFHQESGPIANVFASHSSEGPNVTL